MKDQIKDNNQPWLDYNENESFEECITGNEEGLKELRRAVDEALEGKFGKINAHFTAINGVVKITGDPREKVVIKQTSSRELIRAVLIALIGCLLIGAIISTVIAIPMLFKYFLK